MSIIGLLAATEVSLHPHPQLKSILYSAAKDPVKLDSDHAMISSEPSDFPPYSELSLISNSLQEPALTLDAPLISPPHVPQRPGKTSLGVSAPAIVSTWNILSSTSSRLVTF